MADDFNPLNYLREIGGVFKLGSGVLGKSAIAVGILMVAVVVAVWRLHSDWAIFGALFVGGGLFFLWFYKVLKFSSDHPDLAVLDGVEWSSFQRFQASVKGSSLPVSSEDPVLLPGARLTITDGNPESESNKG